MNTDHLEGTLRPPMAAHTELSEAQAAPAFQGQTPILEARHLRKYFPVRQFSLGAQRAVHAVEDASLVLTAGRALALVGESGSGKSTVARMLARLYEPTAGEILFRGQPVKAGKSSLRAYRQHVQMVFQDPFS